MSQFVIVNNVNTTLASALPSSSTTIVLASSANLPTLSAGQIMPITLNDEATGLNYEICYVTAISGTSLTVTRAQEGTSALNWNVGDYAFCAFTSGTTAVSTGNPGNTFQVAAPTAANQAIPAGQAAGVVGAARNLVMSVTAASASATLTADEIIVETALGGIRYCLSSFSKTINLATTGAGGMDVGTAPVSGFVALYAIYNPITATSALLATNVSSSVAPNIYGGGNMPAGYTASALVSVWPTNASSQFAVGFQDERKIWITPQAALSTNTQQSSLTALSISSLVPKGAKRISGNIVVGSSSANASMTGQVAGSAQAFGGQQLTAYTGFAGQAYTVPFNDVPLITAQTMYYSAVVNTGTMALTITLTAYTF